MEKQLSRIESFVTNLVNNEFTNGQMAMVLSADCDAVGAKNRTCENLGSGSCTAKNSKCTNVGVCSSTNTDICSNKPPSNLTPAPDTKC